MGFDDDGSRDSSYLKIDCITGLHALLKHFDADLEVFIEFLKVRYTVPREERPCHCAVKPCHPITPSARLRKKVAREGPKLTSTSPHRN